MTTPVKEMGLDKTISEITKLDTAIKISEQKYADLNDAYASGKVPMDRQARKAARDEMNALYERRASLENSITRRMTGEKGARRETLVKGKEQKDIGPYLGEFRGHYGVPRG